MPGFLRRDLNEATTSIGALDLLDRAIDRIGVAMRGIDKGSDYAVDFSMDLSKRARKIIEIAHSLKKERGLWHKVRGY